MSHDPIVERIAGFQRSFVAISPEELLITSHYVLHTHQFSERCEQPYTTPYLYIHSAQKGSGKTLLGNDILGCLCRNFQAVNNVTPATLFRLTEARCTLAIDEVDILFDGTKSNDDLVSVLNTGYRKGGYVPRADSKAEDGVRRYSTFGPKILIGIDNGKMKDTTRERCIPIHMHRATDEERKTVQPFYHYKVEDEIESLNAEIYNWSFEHTKGMREYEPEVIESLSPRQWEIVMPLLQVARVTGYEAEMREAIEKVFEDQIAPENSVEIDMLVTLQTMFEANGDRIASADVLAELHKDNRFKGWNGKMLGGKLAPFGIKIKPLRLRGEVCRGIMLSDCVDAFERYLGE